MPTALTTAAPCDCRLVAAALLGGSSVLFALYGSTRAYIDKTDMSHQNAFTVGNQYHMVHAITMATIAIMTPKGAGAAGCRLCLAYCAFGAGTVVLALSRYMQSTCKKNWKWLNSVSRLGGLMIAGGWGLIACAACAACKASKATA